MNKLICGLIGFALMSSLVMADTGAPAPSAKDLSKVVEKVNYIETDVSGVKLSGYVDAGYIYNFGSGARTQGYSTDANSKGDFSVNAVKLTLEKALTDENKLQAGFRTDIMLGEDAEGLSGNFNGSSSLYLQQAYVIFRLPYGNSLDIQFGQMNSLLGFEADERPANMNITQGSNAALDPGPSAGIQLSYPVTDIAELLFGVNNGNGLSSNNGLDNDNDGYAFVGAVNFHNTAGNAETQLAVQYSPWGDPGVAENGDNTSTLGLNWWGAWSPKFAQDKLLLAFNTSLWNVERVDIANNDSATYATGALYAKYQFTDLFSLAGRAEYTHTDNAAFIFDNGLRSDDLYSLTLTAGFNVAENLLLRAEYRFDVGNNVTNNDGDTSHGVSFEAVYIF